MVAITRAQVNLVWDQTIQNKLSQPSLDQQQGQTLSDSVSINYQDSAFQDSQDPWPIIPLRTPSDHDSDNFSDQNMDVNHKSICK